MTDPVLLLLLLVGYFRLMCICSLQGLCLRSSHRERFEFQGKAAKRAHWKSAGRRKVPKRRICHTFHQTGSTNNRTLLTSRFHSIRISRPIHGGNDQKRSKGTVKVPIFDRAKFQVLWKQIFEIVKKEKMNSSLYLFAEGINCLFTFFTYFFGYVNLWLKLSNFFQCRLSLRTIWWKRREKLWLKCCWRLWSKKMRVRMNSNQDSMN